ncbi:hypothetical protein DFJ73DRAFT_116827 [Zopfochytrium polystomum]|nr:hypothetical protein DFJ73DRAFT_116827 [Zopfochytrium polystomum]
MFKWDRTELLPWASQNKRTGSDSSSDSARSVGLTLPMSSPSSPALRHLPPSTSASITSPVGTDSPRPSTELVIVVSGEEPATEKKDDKRSESPESDAASAVAEPIRAPASPVLSIGRMSISARLAATVNAALSSIPSPPVSASAADPQTVNHPSSPLRSASPANSFTSTNSMSRNRSSSSTLLTYTPSSAVSLTASAAATASTSTISPTGEVDPATKERLARAVRMSELSLAARLSRVVARHSVSTPNLGTPMARQPSATDASNSTSTIATAATSLGRLQTGHKSSFTAAARSPRTSMIGHPLTPTTPNAAVSKLEMLMGSLEQLERDDDSPASSPVDPPAELANPSDPVVPSSSSPVLSAREQPTATDAAAAAAEPELVDAEDLAAAAEVAMVRRALMAEDAEDARAAAEVELVRRALLADEGLGGVFEPTSSLATLVEGHLAIFEAAAGSSGSGGGGVVGKGAEVPVVSQAASVHG